MGIFETLFGNSITKKVEKHNRLIGDIEVLKKQQKVSSEAVLKSYATKKRNLNNSVDADIARLQAEISSLKEHRVSQLELLEEERKVMLDKTINDFDRRITNKFNKAKKLEHLINAEKANMEDIIKPAFGTAAEDTQKAVNACSYVEANKTTTKTNSKKTSK